MPEHDRCVTYLSGISVSLPSDEPRPARPVYIVHIPVLSCRAYGHMPQMSEHGMNVTEIRTFCGWRKLGHGHMVASVACGLICWQAGRANVDVEQERRLQAVNEYARL